MTVAAVRTIPDLTSEVQWRPPGATVLLPTPVMTSASRPRRRLIRAGLVLLVLVAPVLVWRMMRPPVTPERIRAGDCSPCLFEAVSFTPDRGLVLESTLSQRTWTRRQQQELQRLDLFKRRHSGSERELVAATVWHRGRRRDASAADLAAYNRCAAKDAPDCDGLRLPVEVPRGSLVVLTLRARILSGFTGGDPAWLGRVPRGLFGPRYGARVQSSRRLHVEGDLVAQDEGLWAFEDRGHGFLAASTAPDWAHVARAYGDLEDRMIREASAALQAIPRAPEGADPEAALQAHWSWIRRNLDYRRNPNLLNGGMAPSPLAETLARGHGDCKDFSLLLRALLQRDGIEAESVLADAVAADDEPWTRVPTPRTDHILVYLPAQRRYIDPTLASRRPLPGAGSLRYDFLVHTRDGSIRSAAPPLTR